MAAEIVELDDASFAGAVSKGVALVDFYGTYCPPCKLLEPILEQLAGDFSGRALIARINVDDNCEAAVDNSVEDIPTLIIFKDGAAAARLFGAQKRETLASELERALES